MTVQIRRNFLFERITNGVEIRYIYGLSVRFEFELFINTPFSILRGKNKWVLLGCVTQSPFTLVWTYFMQNFTLISDLASILTSEAAFQSTTSVFLEVSITNPLVFKAFDINI